MLLKLVTEDVTFAQLRTFACAAEAGSFAKAAELLDISQPAVSEHIHILEERLGRLLFERRRGTTSVLTSEGEDALELVRTILTASADLFGGGRKPAHKEVVRISIGPFLRENYVRRLVPRIYREFPGLEIDFHPTMMAAEVLRRIQKGEYDLAIFSITADEGNPQYSRMICEFPLAMVAPPGTRARLAAGECSLRDFQYLFPGRREDDSRRARKFIRDLGLGPGTPVLYVEFVEALAQMVEDGQGIGHLVPTIVADRIAAGRLEVLDIPLAPMRRFICRSPHAPPVAREIEEMLCDVLALRHGEAKVEAGQD
ncbi:MAG: LysR family transcriptional regulator [Sphingomonadales bacterium]|nr:LysR family transcriptional regulator [Sphingomonadales bacterium]